MPDEQTTISNLPAPIQDIVLAEYQRVLSAKIRRAYHLSFEEKAFIENTVEDLFLGKVKISDLEVLLQKNITTKNIDIKKLASDIIGLRLYIATPFFKQQGQDIEVFLNARGGITEEYKNNAQTMKKAIAEEKAGTYDHDSYLYPFIEKPKITEKEADPTLSQFDSDDLLPEEQRMARLENFFTEGIADALDLPSGELLEELNDELIVLLPDHPELQKNLKEKLSSGLFKIGTDNIVFEERPLAPTAANWLKEFFSVAGADSFDTLSIAKYIISSANAKKLSEEEQTKLRRFLTLYHNIHFFPTPFTAIPVDKWEIIPGARTTAAIPETKTLEKRTIETKAPAIKQPKWSVPQSTAVPVVKDTTSPGPKSAELIELEKMRDQYAVGSLERSAIEEEIKHLQ